MSLNAIIFGSYFLLVLMTSSLVNAVGMNLSEVLKKFNATQKTVLSQTEKAKQLAAAVGNASSTKTAQNVTQALKESMASKGMAALAQKAAESAPAVVANEGIATSAKKFCWRFASAVSAATGVIQLANNVADMGRSTRSYLFPTEEEKLHAHNASIQLKIFRARVALNEALVIHARAEKGTDGIPLPCKAKAEEYAKWAGYAALKQMIDEFKQCCHLFC